MFGHVRGAFTDAREDKPGRFEIASGGTLFLDEIGNLPMHLQSKLLNVLQNREISRVGSTQVIPVDIRLISASNKDLDGMTKNGTFREDLLYRINTIHIEVPPLRERKADIHILANHYLDNYSRKYSKSDLFFSKAALNRMISYDWPGNIRELQHTIEKVVILSEDNRIDVADLFASTSGKAKRTTGLNLEENEKYLILKAIEINRGNLSRSARELGISRKTLYNKLEKYHIGSLNLTV
jgi:transcriptional regulator with PAS, ATPase and Fis domain